MTNQTNQSSLGSVSFLNMFGILVSIILCVLFIILGGHTLKYFKAFAVKIKIIVNRAEDKNVQLKDFNYQGKENTKRSEAYEELESIYKNEIKKSRSLQFWNIMKNLIAKYDHILYYPFRDKMTEQYDLLKPKTTFYVLLVITTCCIAWMTTIFLSAILQSSYSDVTLIPLGTFVGITIAISIISSILNLIATNRLFRIYLINVKGAFKVDYGHKFLALDQGGLQDYQPENSDEEDEMFRHQEMLKNLEVIEEIDQEDHQKQMELIQSGIGSNRFHEESQINSTRKLLGEDLERSDKLSLQIRNQEVIEEQKHMEEQENFAQEEQLPLKKRVQGKAIKDIFDLQVGIEGADDANTEDKYIFVEDKHAMGDMDLLENEALKGENKSNLTTFVVLFVIIAIASAFCCYLNYTFQKLLAQAVFVMFICSFFGDILVSRPLILLLITLFKYCKAKKQGYKKVQYKSTADIKQALNKAIKDMFDNRRKLREGGYNKNSTTQDRNLLSLPQNKVRSSNDSNENNHTQNLYERNDTTMKQPLTYEEGKEDEYAHEVEEKKDGDDFDGPKIPAQNFINGFHPTEYARPQIEDEQKKHMEQNIPENTQVFLLSNFQKAVQEKENEMSQALIEKKTLSNDLVDYNLLLLRKIYDAYEDRAEKVIKHFRSDRNGVIRKRYMVPILNPNYDYEKLLREMQEAGKGAKDKEEEESVHLDGVTVCEDFERQLMEAIIQEASDDLISKKVDRIKIDKFGNPIDEDKFKDGITKATPAPAFGYIEHTVEENIDEDDEVGRKRRLLEMLRQKLASGQELTAEELALLEQLENERLAELEKLIKNMLSKGYDNLSDDQKLQLIQYQKEKFGILLDQVERKKEKNKEDFQKIKEYQDELKRLELEELRLRSKMGQLSKEELDRLWQLEEERLAEIHKRIAELEKKGWDNLENKEKFELLGLQKEVLNIELDRILRKKKPLSDEDLQRIDEIEDELRQLELKELLLKQQLGLLTDEERKRLLELQNYFDEQTKMRELAELEALRQKLLNGGKLTDEEIARLRELQLKYGIEPDENMFGEQVLLNDEFDDNMQDDDELMHSRITDQDNFSELPPIQVMNNFSKPQSPEKLLDQIDEMPNDFQVDQTQDLDNNYNTIKVGDIDVMNMNNNIVNPDLENGDAQKNIQNADGSYDPNSNNLDQNTLILTDAQLREQELAKQKQQEEQERIQREQEISRQKQEQEEFERAQREQELLNQKRLLEEENLRNISGIDQNLDDQHNLADNVFLQQETSNLDMADQNKGLDDDLAFGHDDLEFGMTAPIGANGEESIYSHKTTTILDEEKVSFMHIEHLPNQDNGSDDSFSEQDMVYYNKDDLTNYSKGLGLNKVKAKFPGQQYFSENDLQEVKEGEISDDISASAKSKRSGRSFDHTGASRLRAGYGRGKIQHNEVDVGSHEDLIEGRVKVDAWNLNYRGKKKKLRKKRTTDNQLKKMHDLQNIYGLDAKTLAGLSKGRLPRQLLATGKLKDDDDGDGHIGPQTENSFRSTQNTFRNKLSTPGQRFKQSINDAQSNMFSMNGFGATRTGWNDSALKGTVMDSRHFQGSNYDVNGNLRRNPMAKLTQTQQDFAKNQRARFGEKDQNQELLEEESKSAHSGSLQRRFQGGVSNNTKGKGKKGKKGSNKKNKLFDDGVDSHTESDEAVDDKGAMFQKKNANKKKRYSGGDGGMNDMDHSESEEGNNQDIPNFQGNNFVFKKRGAQGQSKKSGQKNGGNKNKKAGLGRNSDLSVEDLEAQVTGNNGKKGRKGRQSSAERGDSEEENLGGQIRFQNRNARNDYDGLGNGYDSSSKKQGGRSNTKQNQSNSKPPLSNRKGNKSNNFRGQGQSMDQNILGSNGFSGSNGQFRQGGVHSDMSDNERYNLRKSHYSNSSADIQGSSLKRNQIGGQLGSQKANKFVRRGGAHSDDEDDYIVGPESNHSSIRKRPLNQRNSGGDQNEQDDERYLLLQRERQIIEDLEESKSQSSNRLAKKRKIRKAAQSLNPRELQASKYREMQNERLRKKQREAEAALFANEDDLEVGKAKKKKKKIKKEQVKKEINYWLDYDSPYAEYLVARFREWSPNPAVMRGPSAGSHQKGMAQSKYKEVMNVYSKNDHKREGSQQSRSRSKGRNESSFNISQQNPVAKKSGLNVANSQYNSNNLFVNDFDEE